MPDESTEERAGTEGVVLRWAGPLLLAVVFALLCAATWLRWADALIDFGAELYLPWRMTLGESPYADLAYRNGPLSLHLNALWFRLFGVSARTLVVCNLVILAGACALVYRFFQPSAGRLGATLCGVVFLAVFGFGHLIATGNFNWVTPYQHPQTHGAALSLGLVSVLAGSLAGVRWVPACGAGVLLGLVLLTKAELMVPAALAAALALGLVAGASGRDAARFAAGLAGGAALPIALFAVLLAGEMPLADVARGLAGNWLYFGASWTDDPFYRFGSGLDRPLEGALAGLGATALLALGGALGVALDRWIRRPGAFVLLTIGFGAFALGAVAVEPGRWLRGARALPFATAALTLTFSFLAWRGAAGSEARIRAGGLAIWGGWATGLLLKMWLVARVEHYGFVLAMPATLLLVAVAVGVGPRALAARSPGSGRVARALAVGVVSAGTLAAVALSFHQYGPKDFAVGSGGDRLLFTREIGAELVSVLERIDATTPPGSSVLVLPEGASLNYWSRRPLPSRHYLFIPTELEAYGGEQHVLRELERDPPAAVVLAARDYHEFGGGAFGSEPRTGEALLRWVRSRYCADTSAPRTPGRTLVLHVRCAGAGASRR